MERDLKVRRTNVRDLARIVRSVALTRERFCACGHVKTFHAPVAMNRVKVGVGGEGVDST